MKATVFKALLVAGLVISPNTHVGAEESQPIELTFGMYATDGMVEQDVFIENPANANEVVRIPVSKVSNHMETQLYAAGEEPPYEPMKLEPTDSYPKGTDLGITLRDWLSAKGSGSYSCDGKKGNIDAKFEGLRPNATYTMWNFIEADPPTEPWQGMVWPAGERDGSQSVFQSDTEGKGDFKLTVEPCLQLSGNQSIAGLAIAWHSDGKTYGFSPGGLGMVSHAQLMTIFPHPGGEP